MYVWISRQLSIYPNIIFLVNSPKTNFFTCVPGGLPLVVADGSILFSVLSSVTQAEDLGEGVGLCDV